MSGDSLRKIPFFADLSDADLEWLTSRAEPVSVESGADLMREGEPGDAAYIVLEGEFEIIKKSSRQNIVIAVREPGQVLGEMALIDQAPRTATVRATRPGQLLRIRGETFKLLLAQSATASLSILQTVSQRLRQNEALLRQNEKMAALGTLAAGLAHELNNPAAAVRRSAQQMKTALAKWEAAGARLQLMSLTEAQARHIAELDVQLQTQAAHPMLTDSLEQSDRESELQSWLELHAVTEAWKISPALAAAGWTTARLSPLADEFGTEAFSAVVEWLAAGLTLHSLLDEVALGAERLSEIVKAVKAYSYLDQAPVQEVNVEEGLENTLVILRHKLNGITIERDYAPDLPPIEAYGSELNQVWTNILDNAIYAMEGHGTIQLRTYTKDGCIIVEIEDSGPGIPADVQPRIFEPFFTTKPPGIGTGLGLHIAYTIVNNHNGRIQVSSGPGRTCFQITLPARLSV